MKILNLLNVRIKANFHTKMFIFYFIFFLIILILYFSLSTNFFNKSYEDEIKKSNMRLLMQVQIYVDKNLLSKINYFINENFLDSSADSSISDFYIDDMSRYPDSVMTAISSISNTLSNFDCLDSICLYRKYDDTLLATNGGIIFNASSPDIKTPSKVYTNILKNIITSPATKLWLSPMENKAYFSNKPIISFVQSIPIYAPLNKSKGFIILNINQDLLLNPIYNIYGQEGELMIIDSDGKLLADSDPAKLMKGFEAEEYTKTIFAEDEGFIKDKINGKNYEITWVKSSNNNLRYISVISVENLNKQLTEVKQVILIIFFVIILLGLIGTNVITSRLYHPLRVLIRKAASISKGENKDGNDLNYINNVFTYLSEKVDEMQVTIEDNKEIIKYKTLIDIFYGNLSNTEDIRNSLRLFDAPLKLDKYIIAIAEIDSNIFSKLSSEQREFVVTKANEIIEAYFSGKNNCISICHPLNCIIVLVNFDEPIVVFPDFNDLLKCLLSELGINFNIAVSKLNDQISALANVYSITRDYLKYSYIYGFNNVFMYTAIERYESGSGDFGPDSPNLLESLLRSCKISKIKEYLSEQINMIKANGYSYNYTQNFLLQTISTMAKVCKEQEITSKELEMSMIVSSFNTISSLDECINWIFSVLDLYYKNVNKRNLSIDQEFIKNIADYITVNIEKQITQNSVAECFNISPSHLSRLFREGLGIGFSDFVLNSKLEKAAELIAGSKDKNIAEIAEKFGYFTPAYFSEIFKKKYGMTPALYRKKMLQSR